MDTRGKTAFLLLILAQGIHSVEEYEMRLFDVFAPARFVSTLVGMDPATGFIIANTALLALGCWCYLAWVRPGHSFAGPAAWAWALGEMANGLTHSIISAVRGGYFPGLWTAPLLISISGFLMWRLARRPG